MSLTAIRSLESAREKFFMNATYIMSRKKESNVFPLRRPNESNSHELLESARRKFFMNSAHIGSRKNESNVSGVEMSLP